MSWRSPNRESAQPMGNAGVSVRAPARGPSRSVTPTRPPLARRCGSSNRFDGVLTCANGTPARSRRSSSSPLPRDRNSAETTGRMRSRRRTRSLFFSSDASPRSSRSSNSAQKRRHWVSLTTPTNIFSPSRDSKTSYMAHAERRTDMGGGASPVTASWAMCWPTRKAVVSNSEPVMRSPAPVRRRRSSAARMPATPNSPPATSTTEAPTRMGRSGRPVM